MNTGTNYCMKCEREFSADVKCCCDYASYDDGTHDAGFCTACCSCQGANLRRMKEKEAIERMYNQTEAYPGIAYDMETLRQQRDKLFRILETIVDECALELDSDGEIIRVMSPSISSREMAKAALADVRWQLLSELARQSQQLGLYDINAKVKA